jgi:hypothetical protein
MLWWLLNTDLWGNVLSVPSASSSVKCVTSMKIWIFLYGKQALCKVFMEFNLLDRMKFWYNTALQVLTLAPALHSLHIRERWDMADILQFLFPIRGYLRKLIFERCWFGENGTGLLANIVALYPDLEILSLCSSHRLTSADYCLIQHLKKLSELNLSECQVHYLCVKLLETHVCIHESI